VARAGSIIDKTQMTGKTTNVAADGSATQRLQHVTTIPISD
jgi:hypothetical protein